LLTLPVLSTSCWTSASDILIVSYDYNQKNISSHLFEFFVFALRAGVMAFMGYALLYSLLTVAIN
jgi:hypothetical protein